MCSRAARKHLGHSRKAATVMQSSGSARSTSSLSLFCRSIAIVRECVAVPHERHTLAMLKRQKGESLAQLLVATGSRHRQSSHRRHFHRRDKPALKIAAPLAAAFLRHKTA
jgi:hypothetical protein